MNSTALSNEKLQKWQFWYRAVLWTDSQEIKNKEPEAQANMDTLPHAAAVS